MDPVTLIFLVVAIIVALKLRNVLGQHDDDDGPRPMDGYAPRKSQEKRPQGEEAGSDNVVTLPTRTTPADHGYQPAPQGEETVPMKEQIRKYAAKGSALEQSLAAIAQADKSFEPEPFLNGAKTAYEMIVMAFAQGNRKLLKQLLAKEVYEGFLGAIDSREKRKLIVDSSFVGIDQADFVSAELRSGRTARITLKFVSSLITATHNRDGDVVDGDPKKVREVTDIWTFAHDCNSKDPNWQLVATESAT